MRRESKTPMAQTILEYLRARGEWATREEINEFTGFLPDSTKRVLLALFCDCEVYRRPQVTAKGRHTYEYRLPDESPEHMDPLYPERTGESCWPLAQAWGGYTYRRVGI